MKIENKKSRGSYLTFLAVLLAMMLIVAVIASIRNINFNEERITTNEEETIAAKIRLTTLEGVSFLRGQRVLELEERIESLEDEMRSLEGRGIFWIVRTGKEIVVLTTDGQELRCYFPNDKEK